jgi:hypothetical protein
MRTTLLSLFALSAAAAFGDITILSPVAVGNSEAIGPFLVNFSTNSTRDQQVYGALDFSAISAGGGLITQIAFEVGGSHAFLGAALPDIQISLSTTPKGPDALSPIFANNVGSDDTVVFGRGILHLPGSNPGEGFNIAIPLSKPFYFNPSAGNLLLDVRNYMGIPITQFFLPTFRAENTLGDSVSSVGSGAVGDSAGQPSTIGLLTLFTVTPVPEPSSLTLLGFGIITVALAVRRLSRRCSMHRRPVWGRKTAEGT